MGNFIVGILILSIICGAAYKIYKDKKNNVRCSGCPSCPSNNRCSAYQKKQQVVLIKNSQLKKNKSSIENFILCLNSGMDSPL